MPWFGLVALVGYATIRAVASIGQSAQRYPDSVGYESFSFLSRTDRAWPVPLVFSLAGSDTTRVIVHVVAGALAWGALAWVSSQSLAWRRSAFAVTLLLGLAPQVIRYDVAILSESLSITFVVMAIAATLYKLRSTTTIATIWWASSLTVCVLARPTHLLIVVICVIPVMWKFVMTRGKSLATGGIGLIALLMVALFTLQQSPHMSVLNLYTVLSSRVITDDQRFEWFVDEGMPNIPGMRTATGYDYAEQLSPELAAVIDLPNGQQPPALMRAGGVELATWAYDNGWRTVVKYLVLHPWDTVSHAQLLIDGSLAPPNGDFLPLTNGPMLPWAMFLPWQLWAIAIIGCCAALALRNTTRKTAVVVLSMTATSFLIYLATVHSSGIEHVRHSIAPAIALRVLGLAAILSLFPKRVSSESLGESEH